MKLIDYLKDKSRYIVILFITVILSTVIMSYGDFDLKTMISVNLIFITGFIIGIFVEYKNKENYYKNISNILNNLEDKSYITEICKSPDFYEGQILHDLLCQLTSYQRDVVNEYKYNKKEYQKYVSSWMLEIKDSIFKVRNTINKDIDNIDSDVDQEITQIEFNIKQFIYYLRSSIVEADYYINKYNLEDLFLKAIETNKSYLKKYNIDINLKDLNKDVLVDKRWYLFIIDQLIANSIDYKDKSKTTSIIVNSYYENKNIVLEYIDSGIEINPEKLKLAILEKENNIDSYIDVHSIEFTLSICNKLSTKMGINMDIVSAEDGSLKIKFLFPEQAEEFILTE